MLQRLIQALSCFPREIYWETDRLSEKQQMEIEEFHLRIGYPPTVVIAGTEINLGSCAVSKALLEETLLQATGQAVYSARDMIKQGFLTLNGGHRMGLCGTAVYKGEGISSIQHISSINLRIASERRGFALPGVQHIWTHPGSTLVISPPGFGKTTFLRDLIFQLSTRFRWRISVCDERMELAACKEGVPQFDLGPTSDILCGTEKSTGIPMLLRTMNPQWIAVDEITSEEDVHTMVRASYCGVRFMATAHATQSHELYRRPVYRQLMGSGIFRNLIIIAKNRELTIKELDAND